MCAEVGKSKQRFLIRAFRPEDIVAASIILQEAEEAARWSVEMLGGTFTSDRVSGFISETDGKPTGFILGREVLDEGEILNLAVVPENRGKGEGTALAKELLNRFAARGIKATFLEVRESNAGAIAFYRMLGFRQVGRRERYYREPEEAALILEHGTNNPQLGTE